MKASMLGRVVIAETLLTALFALAGAQPATAATINVSATIKGTLSKFAHGECTTGYADQCPSDNCVFSTPVGTPTISGTFKGTITGLCVTIDAGDRVTIDEKHTCAPMFGDMVVVTNGGTTNTAINFTGALCSPQPKSSLFEVESGFGINGANSTDPNATGWGTITGTADNTGATLLKVKGNFTP